MTGVLQATAAGVTRKIVPKLAVYAPALVAKGNAASSSSLHAVCRSLRKLNKDNSDTRGFLFSGVQVSLEDLGNDHVEQKESCQLIQEHGLELVLNLDIQSGMSSNNHKTDLVRSFESKLEQISKLGSVVAHINCVCSNILDKDEALEYLLDVLPLSAKFLEDHSYIGKAGNEIDIMGGAPDHLTGISHQTTGMLFHPDTTRYLLEVIPPMRLTMDLSSWHEACGYPWGDSSDKNEEEALSVEIVHHIDLIRTNSSLLSIGVTDANCNKYLEMHQTLWESVWTRKANRGVEQLYMTLDDIGDHHYKGNDSNEDQHYSWRIKRLADTGNTIHRYYDTWAMTRNMLEKESR